MALSFGGSDYIRNAAATITGTPFSMGCWFQLAAVGSVIRAIMSLSDTGTGNNYFTLNMQTNETIGISASVSSAVTGTTATPIIAGAWQYGIARFISATERRLSVLGMGATTLISHANNTTSTTPTGIDMLSIGARENSSGLIQPWSGRIAEAWIADADVFQSGSDMPNEMVMEMAFGGPFAMPGIANKIVEYRSLRCGVDSRADKVAEVYYRGARTTWGTVGAPKLSSHPPLPYWFQRPAQVMTELVI